MNDLDRIFGDLDQLDVPVSWSDVQSRQPSALRVEDHRASWGFLLLFGLVATLGAIVLLARAFVIPGHHGPATKQPAVISSGPTSGTSSFEVGGSGLVVATSPQDVTFCGGAAEQSYGSSPPGCSPPLIRVVGVDLSALPDRISFRGTTWGSAYLAGTFRDGVLYVSRQGPTRPSGDGPTQIKPPCAAPPNGWAPGPPWNPSWDAVDAYRRRFPADVTMASVFSPDPRTWVMTVASTDAARTESLLRKDYPDRLCVVASRYELVEVRHAKAQAMALFAPPPDGRSPYWVTDVHVVGGDDGQPLVWVEAVLDTPELRQALASQPAGLVEIAPWLKPVSG